MDINAQVITEMAVPDDYIESLPKVYIYIYMVKKCRKVEEYQDSRKKNGLLEKMLTFFNFLLVFVSERQSKTWGYNLQEHYCGVL